MNEKIKPLFNLENKVAIVTGSSKGIGESIARGLAEFGAKVIISSRRQESVDEVAEAFRKDGLEATGIACHVGDMAQIDNLVSQTVDLYGRVDVLVNNAAINPYFGPIEGTEETVQNKVMNINLQAPLELSKKVFPHMKEQGGGSIMNISSVEGLKPANGLGIYSVSKAAVVMLSNNLAKEWGKYGIRTNTICPGLVKTKLSEALWSNEKMLGTYNRMVPLGRMAMPEELAGIAVFLASDASSYITGGVFTVDGGYMLAG